MTSPARIPAVERIKRYTESAILTRANVVTIARVVLTVPVLLLVLDEGSSWLTWGGWFFLSVTDGLDGWIARRDGTTRSGAFLDPIADKFLVLGGFVVLAINDDFSWVPVILVIVREVGISVYRSAAGRRGISLPARQLGKWKAVLQFLAVGFVLFPPTADADTFHLVMLWSAVAISLVSALDIVRLGWVEARDA
ncbi:MAG TPA: CDP-alcohol phosphatidyltransferase family protein [Acidimicrobiia bacterium]|nr:CDP-alcohol phosphatidyltransferase family protein [Acidimicrobiia bacterium]